MLLLLLLLLGRAASVRISGWKGHETGTLHETRTAGASLSVGSRGRSVGGDALIVISRGIVGLLKRDFRGTQDLLGLGGSVGSGSFFRAKIFLAVVVELGDDIGTGRGAQLISSHGGCV